MTKKHEDDRVMRVEDVMTREVVTVLEEESVAGIEEGMERFRFHHLPVVDGTKLVGLLTHRDLLRIGSSPLEGGAEERTRERRERTFVRDVMRTRVFTVRPETPLVEAAIHLRDDGIGCLPVIDADGDLVGIVTSRDLIDLAVKWLGGPSRS